MNVSQSHLYIPKRLSIVANRMVISKKYAILFDLIFEVDRDRTRYKTRFYASFAMLTDCHDQHSSFSIYLRHENYVWRTFSSTSAISIELEHMSKKVFHIADRWKMVENLQIYLIFYSWILINVSIQQILSRSVRVPIEIDLYKLEISTNR